MEKQLIFIVDDEKNIRELIKYNLEKSSFIVEVFASGIELLKAMEDRIPALICLDLMLPDYDGLELCKRIRLTPKYMKIPIIMITAKTAEFDTIIGLEAGADDYIKKPFSINEIIARIRAILRRGNMEQDESDTEIIRADNIIIDKNKRVVKINEIETSFTLKEFELLLILIEHKGKVFNRDMLLEKIWGYDYYGGTRTVDVHIHALRRIIGEDKIKTVRGVGYKYDSKEK